MRSPRRQELKSSAPMLSSILTNCRRVNKRRKPMKHVICRYILILGLVAVGLVWSGEIWPTSNGMSGIYRGSGRRCTSNTGQLCRCGATLHCRSRSPWCWCYAGSGSGCTRSWSCTRGRCSRRGSCTWSWGRGTRSWCSTSEPGWTREQGRGALNKPLLLSAQGYAVYAHECSGRAQGLPDVVIRLLIEIFICVAQRVCGDLDQAVERLVQFQYEK